MNKYSQFLEVLKQDVQYLMTEVYYEHFYVIQAAIVILTMWVFFKLGRFRSKDMLLESIKTLNSYESNKAKLSQQEGVLLRRSQLLNRVWLVLTFVVLFVNVFLHWDNFSTNELLKKIWMPPLRETFQTVVVTLASLTLLLLLKIVIRQYEKFARTTTRQQLSQLESQENSHIDNLMAVLGSKALDKIKLRLCRQLMLKLAKESSSVGCKKEKCSGLRKLLKQSYDMHSKFIRKIFEFKWCDNCLLPSKNHAQYQEKPIEKQPDEPQSQHDEVTKSLLDLKQRCASLLAYLNSKCRSYCRTKYWKYSKEIGLSFKQQKMQVSAKLKPYESG